MRHLITRFLWHIAPHVPLPFPVHIDLELTSHCNLKCSFCHRENKKFKDGQFSFLSMTDFFSSYFRSIKFNWRGEPTLDSMLPHWLSFARTKKRETMLNTNAAAQILDITTLAHVDDLKVSFDSCLPMVYESIRKGARFHRTLQNIIYLAMARGVYKRKPLTISRRETEETESNDLFKSFFQSLGIDVEFDIAPAIKRNENGGFLKNDRPRKYCGQPSRRLVIGWNGDVFACCVAYNEPQQLRLGNIHTETIHEIWKSPKRKALVRKLKKGLYPCDECVNCTSRDAYKK